MTRWQDERSKRNWLRQGDATKILLVEGQDDAHSIIALCEAHDLADGLFSFFVCDSVSKALAKLDFLISDAEPRTAVGIVVDADEAGTAARWDAIRSKPEIRRHYSLPPAPDAEGTIVPGTDVLPALGVWLMPDNVNPGMLEDFLLHLAPPDGIAAARDTVAGVRGQPWAPFRDVHHSKAVIHTWLAWQDEPGKPLGQSITSHALRPHTPIAISFTDWLKRLFNV